MGMVAGESHLALSLEGSDEVETRQKTVRRRIPGDSVAVSGSSRLRPQHLLDFRRPP